MIPYWYNPVLPEDVRIAQERALCQMNLFVSLWYRGIEEALLEALMKRFGCVPLNGTLANSMMRYCYPDGHQEFHFDGEVILKVAPIRMFNYGKV